MELHDGTGALIAKNNNWQTTEIFGIITSDQVSAIQNSGWVPGQPSDSAIIATLQPGAYTAIVSGANNTTGVALVEVYDLSPSPTSILGNISTRGFVQTVDNVMIGGFIVEGTTSKTVVIRAIGSELTQYGVANALADPTFELHDATGALIASNDNWQTTIIGGIITSDQVSDIYHTGLAPADPSESVIVATLAPGHYTAIVRGANNTTGVALVEVYDLDPITLETVTQQISAAQGGTITLPSGSSVTIPGGVLPSDQLVTLSLLFKSPKQPPNGFIVAVGPALSISFANASEDRLTSGVGSGNKSNTPSTTFQVILNYAGSTANGFNGAAPISEYTFGSSVDNWWGPPGQIDTVNQTVTYTVDPTIFSGTYGHTINDFGFIFTQGNTQGNTKPNLRANISVLQQPGLKYWDVTSNSLLPFPTSGLPSGWDPNAKTLSLVAGMNSSIEEAFGTQGTCLLPCADGCDDGDYPVNKIAQAGNYPQIIGFDYDWTQPLLQSATALKVFISTSGLKNVDLEGHSEGGAVVVRAASLVTDPTIQISHIVTLGGATQGTPVANAQDTMATFLLANPYKNPIALLGAIPVLHDLLTAPVVSDLQPGSQALQDMVRDYNTNPARSSTIILPVAGTTPMLGTQIFGDLLFFGGETFDGIIAEPDALLNGSLLHGVQPVGSFAVTHTELECNNNVVQAVGQVVNSGTPTPTPTATPSTWIGGLSGSVTDEGGGGCAGTAQIRGTSNMTVTGNPDGTYSYSGTFSLSQGPGICDDYSGDYFFSGTVSTLNGGATTFDWGLGSAQGTFMNNTFSGDWSFTSGNGPDVGNGTFILTPSPYLRQSKQHHVRPASSRVSK